MSSTPPVGYPKAKCTTFGLIILSGFVYTGLMFYSLEQSPVWLSYRNRGDEHVTDRHAHNVKMDEIRRYRSEQELEYRVTDVKNVDDPYINVQHQDRDKNSVLPQHSPNQLSGEFSKTSDNHELSTEEKRPDSQTTANKLSDSSENKKTHNSSQSDSKAQSLSEDYSELANVTRDQNKQENNSGTTERTDNDVKITARRNSTSEGIQMSKSSETLVVKVENETKVSNSSTNRETSDGKARPVTMSDLEDEYGNFDYDGDTTPFNVDGIESEMAQNDPYWGAGCSKMPDCLIIGFEKCGTVTLRQYLAINPDVFAPPEANEDFFNPEVNVSFMAHSKLSLCTPTGKVRVEKMAIGGRPNKVYRYNKNMKLIAIVKDPVVRSLSHFVHRTAKDLETPGTFGFVIKDLLNMTKIPNSILLTQSMYVKKLEKWLDFFKKDRILIVNGDNFVRKPAFELKRVEAFLGIKSYIKQSNFVYNDEKGFYCIRDKDEDLCMSSKKGRPHPPVDKETVKILSDFFEPYNEKFFETFGRRYNWTGPNIE